MFMAGPFPLEGEAAGATVAPAGAGAGAGTPWSVHVRGGIQFAQDAVSPLVHDADPGGGVVAEHLDRGADTGFASDAGDEGRLAGLLGLAGALRFHVTVGAAVRLVGRLPFGVFLVQT